MASVLLIRNDEVPGGWSQERKLVINHAVSWTEISLLLVKYKNCHTNDRFLYKSINFLLGKLLPGVVAVIWFRIPVGESFSTQVLNCCNFCSTCHFVMGPTCWATILWVFWTGGKRALRNMKSAFVCQKVFCILKAWHQDMLDCSYKIKSGARWHLKTLTKCIPSQAFASWSSVQKIHVHPLDR